MTRPKVHGDRFLVCAKRCDECLFSRAKVVDEPAKQRVLDMCVRRGSAFICHKFSIKEMHGELSHADANVCCRGYFDAYPNALVIVLARMLGIVRFVDWDGTIIGREVDGHHEEDQGGGVRVEDSARAVAGGSDERRE